MELYGLPEDCIAEILSGTSPQDVCRLSVVSTIFRSVADSDSVWEKFLPSNIELILSSSVSSFLPNFSSKKEQFLHLCDNPLLIDDGTMTFALEKCSGKKCYMIGAKELSITWGDNPNYWSWPSLPESRFSEVAELLSVCWLDLCGRIETRLLSPDTTYVAYLVLKLTTNVSGFDYYPVELSVKLASESHAKVTSVCLTTPEETEVEGFGELPEETDADSGSEGEVPEETEADPGSEREVREETDADSGSEGEVPEETEADPGSEREVREEIEADSGLEGEISKETEAEGEVPEETGADSGPEEEVSEETEADLRLEGEVTEEADSGPEGEVPEETETDSQLEGEITEDTESDFGPEGEVPEETGADSVPERKVLKERGDGWMEIRMGEFFNERGEDGEVEMSLREIKILWWKSGIIIEGIELRPKDNQ
ncbi:hypothetical protein NE237_014262 [Protea cynaroides]|uniref:F-box domain-containing protein n=1 Tax=Protea cynaroides TaxID=273540 RepID=A0A9Q0GKG7_9MAGN|nr:hypothetical protein NE237_014262 [Protea cynaroides]